MSTMEITLLILGLVAFAISFMIPGKGERADGDALSADELRALSDEEYENAKVRIQNLADETCDYAVEKSERSLERLTNEKMLALGEYSDTIMSQINTNHQETVFLHDMLNQNKNDLQVLLSQAVKDSKQANDMASEALSTATQAIEYSANAVNTTNQAIENANVAEEQLLLAKKNKLNSEFMEPAPKKTTKPKTTRKRKTPKSDDLDILMDNDGQISLNFDMDENASNNNERVLELHREGKSNVAIAKELDLGVGEVKLIIDLFEKK